MAGRESNAFIPEASLPEMIDELKSVLVPDDEIARIRQYGDVMREAREQRAKEREQLLATLHDMEEAVRELRETSTRASADWRSLAAHTAAMQEMENEKFDLAKKINEQEAALSMLETEIEELRRESDDVEDWDVEQSVDTDKNALALQLFRGMGFVPHHSASVPDEPFSVLLVRSSKRNAAASFDVDPASMQKSKLSSAQLAAQLWAAAE